MSGVIVSLFLLFDFINHELSIIIFVPFLKLEFVSFLCLIAAETVGLLWSSIIIVISLLIRLSFDFEPIGMLALLIAYLVFSWTFILNKFWIYKVWIHSRGLKNKEFNEACANNIINGAAVILAVLIVSLTMVFCNYVFIYRLYIIYYHLPLNTLGAYYKLIGFIAAFNLIQYGVNGAILIMVYPALSTLTIYHFSFHPNRKPERKTITITDHHFKKNN